MDAPFADPVSRMNGSPGSLTIGDDALIALTPLGRELLRAMDDEDDEDGSQLCQRAGLV